MRGPTDTNHGPGGRARRPPMLSRAGGRSSAARAAPPAAPTRAAPSIAILTVLASISAGFLVIIGSLRQQAAVDEPVRLVGHRAVEDRRTRAQARVQHDESRGHAGTLDLV